MKDLRDLLAIKIQRVKARGFRRYSREAWYMSGFFYFARGVDVPLFGGI